MTMKTQQFKTYGNAAKVVVYSNTILPQETRKTLNIQPNFTPKQLEKEDQKIPKKILEGKS